MNELRQQLGRWKLWLAVRTRGLRNVPAERRRWLRLQDQQWRLAVRRWNWLCIRGAVVQPFLDLLNRPKGGEVYCGGVLFDNPKHQPQLRHYRGIHAVDRPLTSLSDPDKLI